MQETVVFKFEVFDESIKQKAMIVIWTFPVSGVTSEVDVKEGGILIKVTGEFDKHEMMKKLKEIDEHVEIIDEAEPEVTKQPAGSSIWPTWERPRQFLEQAKALGTGVGKFINPEKKEDKTQPLFPGGKPFNNHIHQQPPQPPLLGRAKDLAVDLGKKAIDLGVGAVKNYNIAKAENAKKEAKLLARQKENDKFAKMFKCEHAFKPLNGQDGKEKKNKDTHKNTGPSEVSSSTRPTGKNGTTHTSEGETTQGTGYYTSWLHTVPSTLSTMLPTTFTGEPSTETRHKESGSVPKKGKKEDPKKPSPK